MKVLMTGLTGFIGRYLAADLTGHEVTGLVRHRDDGIKADQIEVDLTEPLPLERLPQRVDAIIHLAQDRPGPGGVSSRSIDPRATEELLRYGLKAGAGLFFYSSTGNVYRPSIRLHQEDDPLDLDSHDPYVMGKIGSERHIGSFQRFYRAVIIGRFFAPYGPGQKNRMIPKLIEMVRIGKKIRILNGGQPAINPIHIRDLCDQVVRLIDLGQPATVNFAGNRSYNVEQVCNLAAEIGGWQVDYDKVGDSGKEFNLIGSNTRVVELTGISPAIELPQGLREMIEAGGG